MKTTRSFEFLPKTWNPLDCEKILEVFNVIQKILKNKKERKKKKQNPPKSVILKNPQ
jgi:hypothetical protein